MKIHTLLKMPPFQGITEEQLLPLMLAPEHACRLYKSSDFVAMQGEVYRSLFILCAGSVRTQMVNPEGKQLTIETLKAPELLAPAFVFSSENRFPVNIEAKEDCEILIVNKDLFLKFMHQHPVVMRNFLRLVSDRTLFLSKKLNSFALQSLKSRILNYIHVHGSILNQQEVAQILGVARPSLARVLSELTHEGCVVMEGKDLRIDTVNARKYLEVRTKL